MYMKKSCQYLRCEILKEQQWLPTIANEFLLWCCQDKLIPHGPWVGAASNAGLHKVHLDPARQPGHGAVTVERVGPQGSVGHPNIRMLKKCDWHKKLPSLKCCNTATFEPMAHVPTCELCHPGPWRCLQVWMKCRCHEGRGDAVASGRAVSLAPCSQACCMIQPFRKKK